MLSLDTETTGVDLYHGTRPFFVTTCDGSGEQQFWEWDVDPLTRLPVVPPEDLREIDALVAGAEELVLQNSKFDCAALATLDLPSKGWPWGKTQDTLIASHVLASNRPHDLTSLAVQYVGWDIKPFEDALEVAVQKCRRWCRSHLPEWRLAKKDLPEMPSAGEKTWKFDTWLPRALVRHLWESSEAGQLYSSAWDLRRASRLADEVKGKTGWEYAPPGVSDKPHPWWTLLGDYANADSAATVEIWKEQVKELHRRGLWEIYLARRQVMGIAHRMERRGVTLSKGRLTNLSREYVQEASHAAEVCRGIAALNEYQCQRCAKKGDKVKAGKKQKELPGLCPVCNGTGRAPYDLELPRGGVNESLRTFIFDVLKLPPITNKKARTDRPTLNAGAVEYYLQKLPANSMQHLFISKLVEKRRRDTAVSYMKGYKRFWLPYTPAGGGKRSGLEPVKSLAPGWFVLHPSLNPTGTDTLRWSSSHPNEMNVSKKEGFNLRYCFGPAPGREWWSLDAKNIELRIPAYESGEKDFIALFERPDDPPYFGSNHLLIAHLLHKDAFEECWSCSRCGKEVWVPNSGNHQEGKFCECRVSSRILDGRVFKKRYASTRYQRTKNGNFALLYGSVDKPDGRGTADRTYGIPGAQSKIKARFAKMEALNQKWIAFAKKHGYVETMPSKAIDPNRGYPIMCSRTEYGEIKPTVPLNYHVQSTAMEWMQSGMVRCDRLLQEWNKREGVADCVLMPVDAMPPSRSYYMILQVHDELVFDFPQDRSVGKGPDGKEVVTYGNLWRVREIQRLMEQGGDDIGVPTPVSCSYHEVSWAEGVDL